MAASTAASMSSATRTVMTSERRTGSLVWMVPSTSTRRQVDPDAALGGELSGDGGGDRLTVVAEADLEVWGAAGIDAVGGQDVSEPFNRGASSLAGAGVA